MRFNWHLRRNHHFVHLFLVQRIGALDNADREQFSPQICGDVDGMAARYQAFSTLFLSG